MAYLGEAKGWELIEEQITCKICGDLFTDPVTVPCLHTFCKRCIEHTTGRRSAQRIDLGCPLCLTSLPRDGISFLPTNATFMSLVNIFKRREERVDNLVVVKCSHCKDSNVQVYKWCVDCQAPLCYDCVEAHSKLKEANSHQTVTIKDFVHQPKKKSPQVKRKSIISIHKHRIKLPIDDTRPVNNIPNSINHTEGHINGNTPTSVPVIKQDSSDPNQLYVAKYNYSTGDSDDLSFNKGDLFYVLSNKGDWWRAKEKSSDKEGFIPRNYVAKFQSLEAEDWFFGTIKREVAEIQLMQDINTFGSFLVRCSEKTPGAYSLAIRDVDKVRHYKIYKLENGRCYVDGESTFYNVQELVSYYSLVADGLCAKLQSPCVISEQPHAATTTTTGSTDQLADDNWETDRSSVCLIKTLGPGQFGEIWEGTWNNMTPVTVKVQIESTTTLKFIEEIELMKQFRHPNLIRLLAVCIREEPICIVMEQIAHSSLLDYLGYAGHSSSLHQLIDIAIQVCSGMAYLERICVVHCDLAARNVLVSLDSKRPVCKIANFGLAQFLIQDVYEAPSGTTFSPKWAAPEVILHSKFSLKSDVWSYGILLYEVMSRGSAPYLTMNNAQAVGVIQKGYRMPCPDDCPEKVYDIMRECWRDVPISRPPFETVQYQLKEFFGKESEI